MLRSGAMPEYPVALSDPSETVTVVLGKLPSPGSWFEISGLVVKVEEVRHIGSEKVILGSRVAESERASLNPKRRRRVIG